MFGLFKDVTKEPGPKLVSKIFKAAYESMNFWLSSTHEDYPSLELIMKKSDLRSSFESHLVSLAENIGKSENPRSTLRNHIIRNLRTYLTYVVLATEENNDFICDAINRWVDENRKEPEKWKTAAAILSDHENFEGDLDSNKVVHEWAWSELEYLVLRHLQIIVFKESNRPEDDWSGLYFKACESVVENVVKTAKEGSFSEEGLPHPILILYTNDELFNSAEKIVAC